MYFSYREEEILRILFKRKYGVTVSEFEQLLNVGRRTVYREMASLQKTLIGSEIEVIKPRGKGYFLTGNDEQLANLKQQLFKEKRQLFQRTERQQAISVNLLLSAKPVTVDEFAQYFLVSQATILSDIKVVTEALHDFELVVHQEENNRLWIVGQEDKRRQIASHLIYENVSEFTFFQYINALETEIELDRFNNYFLSLLDQEILSVVKTSFDSVNSNIFEEVTDNQLEQVMIDLAVSLMRLKMGEEVLGNRYTSEIGKNEVNLAQEILGKASLLLKISIEISERHFFSQQLSGVNYKSKTYLLIDHYDGEVLYQVRELIRLVTEYTGNDFQQDHQLYYNLVAHLDATLKRLGNISTSNNQLLERIISEYGELYEAVSQSVKQIFEHTELSRNELAFIVIHFATSFEQRPTISYDLNVLLVCSSGVGTARILKSRLKKAVPELNHLEILKLSELQQTEFHHYDLVLSTIHLPDKEVQYQMISPLLLDDEVDQIKQVIKAIQKKKRPVIKPKQQEHKLTLLELSQATAYAQDLYQKFRLVSDITANTIEKALEEGLATLTENQSINNERVKTALLERAALSPIGIPSSNLALFHTRNVDINASDFFICELSEPLTVRSMANTTIALKRLLIMLAPENLENYQQQVLGAISTSVIEKKTNTLIYNNGDEEQIKQLLSDILINELQHLE